MSTSEWEIVGAEWAENVTSVRTFLFHQITRLQEFELFEVLRLVPFAQENVLAAGELAKRGTVLVSDAVIINTAAEPTKYRFVKAPMSDLEISLPESVVFSHQTSPNTVRLFDARAGYLVTFVNMLPAFQGFLDASGMGYQFIIKEFIFDDSGFSISTQSVQDSGKALKIIVNITETGFDSSNRRVAPRAKVDGKKFRLLRTNEEKGSCCDESWYVLQRCQGGKPICLTHQGKYVYGGDVAYATLHQAPTKQECLDWIDSIAGKGKCDIETGICMPPDPPPSPSPSPSPSPTPTPDPPAPPDDDDGEDDDDDDEWMIKKKTRNRRGVIDIHIRIDLSDRPE